MLFYDIDPVLHSAVSGKIADVFITGKEYHTPCYMALYIFDGNAVIIEGDNLYKLSKNSLLIIKKSSIYQITDATEDTNIAMINFDYLSDTAPSDIVFDDAMVFSENIMMHNMPSLVSLFDNICRLYISDGRFSRLSIKGKLISILAIVAQGHIPQGYISKNSDVADRVISYIDNNYFLELTNSKIGEIFNFHPTPINRYVKEKTGFSLHEYISVRRISKSIELLEDRDMKINEISETIGFANASSYSRAFHKYMGVYPKNYKLRKECYSNDCSKYYKKTDFKSALDIAVSDAERILWHNLVKYYSEYPGQYATDGVYRVDKNVFHDWHCGVWSAMYWFMYELTGNITYRRYAERIRDTLYDIIETGNMWHIDMAMIFMPVCMYDIKYNKSDRAKKIIVIAANCLMEKYDAQGRINKPNFYDSKTHRTRLPIFISRISILNNNILLKKAYDFTGNSKYIRLAKLSSEIIFKHNIDTDGRCHFDVVFDNNDITYATGKEFGPMTCIQRELQSTAWGLWCLAMLYNIEPTKYIFRKFNLVFEYFKSNISDRYFYTRDCWTLGTGYSSSASAKILCALLEMCKHIPKDSELYNQYDEYVQRLFWNLYKYSKNSYQSGRECLLENSNKSYAERDISSYTSGCIAGDYFWLEALMRLRGTAIFWDF